MKANLFLLKNIIINLINRFNISSYSEEISKNGELYIKIKDNIIAIIQEVNSNELKKFGIKSDVYFSTIDLDLFYSSINDNFFNVKPISKFPKVVRDFSFLINNNILFTDIKNTIISVSPNLISAVSLTDSYTSQKTKNKTSYSFSVSLNPNQKTMSDKEIKNISEKIVKSVIKQHNAVLRDQ